MAQAKAGLINAWNQGIERLNRDLKATRDKMTHRTAVDVVSEVEELIRKGDESEEKALRGEGDMRLSPLFQHHRVTATAWAAMNSQERRELLLRFTSTRPSKQPVLAPKVAVQA